MSSVASRSMRPRAVARWDNRSHPHGRRAVQGVVGATEGGGDSGHEEQHRQDEYGAAHLARVAEDRRRQPCGAGGCDRRAERRRHPARAD
ncbi:hypothetical protein E4K10_03995 [Streptomyces sp. T1317-0309]|nr:hypothetical protein E4K10_03995 [Streptomyces sp. T1317-0309]